jgi:tetratricopeptide (TPR) repeat protein
MTTRTKTEAARSLVSDSREVRDLNAELRRIETLAAAGQYEDVTSSLLELANGFHYAGLPRLVLAAVADLRDLVPAEALSKSVQAWVANYEALGQSGLGNEQRAGELLEQMLALGRELDDDQVVSTALQNLGVRALIRGDADEAIRLGSEAYTLKRELGDAFAAAQILLNLAGALHTRGDLGEAERIVTEFAPLITRVRDAGLRASLYGNLGQLQAARGEFAPAEKSFRKALRAARSAGDLSKEVIALQNLGSLEVDRNRPKRALRWYQSALRVSKQADAPPQLELIYRSLATAYHRAGRDGEAAEALEQAQQAADRFGDTRLRAAALTDLAALRTAHGQLDEAQRLFREAAQIFDTRGERDRLAETLRNLAIVNSKLGDTEGATAAIEQALALTPTQERDTRADMLQIAAQAALAGGEEQRAVIYLHRDSDEAGTIDPAERVRRQLHAAMTLRRADAVEASLPFLDAAITASVELEDDQLIFDSRNDRAIALLDLERHGEASSELDLLLALSEEKENRAMRQQALHNLGEAARRRDQLALAVEHGRAAASLAEELGDVRAQSESLSNTALALADADRLDEAWNTYLNAAELARRVRDDQLEARAISGRARVAFLRNEFAQAAELYGKAADRSQRDDREHIFDLAGKLESLSAAGSAELQETAQALVDVAQRSQQEDEAVTALARSARWWLQRGDLEEAAGLFATAFVLGAVGANIDFAPPADRSPIDPRGARLMILPATFLVLFAEQELVDGQDDFYERVFTTLDRDYEGIGHHLRFVLDVARESASRENDDTVDD